MAGSFIEFIIPPAPVGADQETRAKQLYAAMVEPYSQTVAGGIRAGWHGQEIVGALFQLAVDNFGGNHGIQALGEMLDQVREGVRRWEADEAAAKASPTDKSGMQ